eukprot:30871-Pelagococcus_subviridis.AAC.9
MALTRTPADSRTRSVRSERTTAGNAATARRPIASTHTEPAAIRLRARSRGARVVASAAIAARGRRAITDLSRGRTGSASDGLAGLVRRGPEDARGGERGRCTERGRG